MSPSQRSILQLILVLDSSNIGGLIGTSSVRNYVYDSYAKCKISSTKISGDPADVNIGIVGSASKFVAQNSFSFVEFSLATATLCGGLTGKPVGVSPLFQKLFIR